MILASHNSWSYAKPKYWYIHPFRFMARCQRKNIQQQWNSGVRVFDLRLYFKDTKPCIRHGIMTFDVSEEQWMKDLAFLNQQAEKLPDHSPVYVRVMLEQNHRYSNQEFLESCFKIYCKSLASHFPYILFIGGTRKYDEKRLYDFENLEPVILHNYSSTTSMFGKSVAKWYAKLDDWWPWLYAHLFNDSIMGKYHNENSYVMMDFI